MKNVFPIDARVAVLVHNSVYNGVVVSKRSNERKILLDDGRYCTCDVSVLGASSVPLVEGSIAANAIREVGATVQVLYDDGTFGPGIIKKSTYDVATVETPRGDIKVGQKYLKSSDFALGDETSGDISRWSVLDVERLPKHEDVEYRLKICENGVPTIGYTLRFNEYHPELRSLTGEPLVEIYNRLRPAVQEWMRNNGVSNTYPTASNLWVDWEVNKKRFGISARESLETLIQLEKNDETIMKR